MPIRCVTFDLDDTLWPEEPLLRDAEDAFYDWLTCHCPRISERYDPQALIVHRRAYFRRYPEKAHDFTYMRRHWLRHLAESFGYGTGAGEQGFRVFWEHRNAVTLFEEAHGALDGMRERYAVGAITNGNADVHYIGIGHYFDFVITAAGAGVAKPKAEIFHAALDAAGVQACHAVHVGDDPQRDVQGANAVGMRSVWVNVKAAPWPGGRPPDAEIRTLDELQPLLERWHDQ